jgi:hypothetical protein
VNYRRELQCVTAACMLIRRDVFKTVGGLDEGYRNGFEDVDLCLKVGERGWRIVYQPASVLYHLESQTPGRMAHEQHNGDRLFARWGDHWWLPDEDAIYFGDGFALRGEDADGKVRFWLTVLEDEAERKRWETVAEAQRQGQRRNVAAVRALLGRAEDWPDEPMVRRWAAALCDEIGAPDLAQGLSRRSPCATGVPAQGNQETSASASTAATPGP